MIDSIAPFSALPQEVINKVKEQMVEIDYAEPERLYLQNHSSVEGFDLVVEGAY